MSIILDECKTHKKEHERTVSSCVERRMKSYEMMHMIRKGKVQRIAKGDVKTKSDLLPKFLESLRKKFHFTGSSRPKKVFATEPI